MIWLCEVGTDSGDMSAVLNVQHKSLLPQSELPKTFQGLFQHLLQAVVVKSVCKPRLTYAWSDIIYVAETAMCTETKVCRIYASKRKWPWNNSMLHARCILQLCYLTNEWTVVRHRPQNHSLLHVWYTMIHLNGCAVAMRGPFSIWNGISLIYKRFMCWPVPENVHIYWYM